MSFIAVKVEWRRGLSGTEGTYAFSPKPVIHRVFPGNRSVSLIVPLRDGVVVQNFAGLEFVLELAGVLYNKTNSWDDMETSRNNMINGIGTGQGQLHLISPQRHIYYIGQLTPDGIVFDPQVRSNIQDYTMRILIPSGKEIDITTQSRTLVSNADVT
jgi:hypothetical protein